MSQPPVHCMGPHCPRTHPGDKWATVRATGEGWFHSRDGSQVFCPDHLPDWVEAWRERRAKVQRTYARLPSVTRCQNCTEANEVVEDTSPEALRDQGDRAGDHVRKTGHTVTVGTSQVLLLQAADLAPAEATEREIRLLT